ncbi:NACHT, LRR and PYD domains-containing protein 14-like [Polymixia lowei]
MDLQSKLKIALKRKLQNRNGATSEDALLPARLSIQESRLDINGSGLSDLNQHEFRFIDKSQLHLWLVHQTVSLSKILSCDCNHGSSNRTIITLGVSGMGKTTAVQSFTLDWAEGKEYQAIHLLFPLSFWELNLLRKKRMSLIELIYTFYPELKGLDMSNLEGLNVWFVFDGLDECRLPLDFSGPKVSDVAELSTVDGLLTSLIRGNLLANAHIWITTRPAAVKRIPLHYVLRMTELQGFSDEQKEQHFRTVIGNDDLANRAIDHVKIWRSLDFLCQIPHICSIMAHVLKNHLLEADCGFKINPISLTQIYLNLVENQVTNPNITMIGKLEQLAMDRSGKDNVLYEHDLRESGISVREASKYSRQCPLVLKEERGLNNTAVYRFGHASIQEFFAACYALDRIESDADYGDQAALFQSCRVLVDQACGSPCGHGDVFLRFVFGLLKDHGCMEPTNALFNYTSRKILSNILSDSAVGLLHCLREFDSRALLNEVKYFLKTQLPPASYHEFKPIQWVFLSQRTKYFEGETDLFEMSVSTGCDDILLRQLPAILKSKKAMLRFCNLTKKCCPALAAVVSTRESYLRTLDLGYNSIRDDGVEKLVAGLIDENCKLKTLRLQGCGLTFHSCVSLASVLIQSPKLRELDLSGNELGDDGLLQLANGIASQRCRIDTLRLSQCNFKKQGCCSLASALQRNSDHLKVLDLSINEIGDEGAIEFFKRVDISKLTKLEMYHCNLTALSCEHICTALQSETSTLVELNLSYNDLKDSGFEWIYKGMFAWCRLEKLNLSRCGITGKGCVYLAKVLCSVSKLCSEKWVQNSDWQAVELTDLDLSMNCLRDRGVREIVDGLKNPFGHLKTLNLSYCGLTEECCAALASGFSSENTVITDLDLSSNELQDRGVKRLCVGLRNTQCKLEKLALRSCGLTSRSIQFLSNALKSNPTHLAELHLMGNNLEESGIRVLTELTVNEKFKLHVIDIMVE